MKFTLPALACTAFFAQANGATLLSSSFAADSSTRALPSVAGSDWAYWATTGTVTGPTNTSAEGGRNFAISAVGTTPTSFLGSGSAAGTKFTYTNGESPVSQGTAFAVGGIRTNLVSTAAVDTGLQVTLSSFTQTSRIQLWTFNYIASSTLNVYLGGSSTVAYTHDVTSSPSGKPGYLYTFDFEPTSTSDQIRIEFIQKSGADLASNIGFQAIAITPIPEPSAVLLGLAALPLMARRRRR